MTYAQRQAGLNGDDVDVGSASSRTFCLLSQMTLVAIPSPCARWHLRLQNITRPCTGILHCTARLSPSHPSSLGPTASRSPPHQCRLFYLGSLPRSVHMVPSWSRVSRRLLTTNPIACASTGTTMSGTIKTKSHRPTLVGSPQQTPQRGFSPPQYWISWPPKVSSWKTITCSRCAVPRGQHLWGWGGTRHIRGWGQL